MTSERFKIALKEVLKHEGGYSNHPDDRGGETNFGITKEVAREAGYIGYMRDLPMDIVEAIYHQHYWVPICGDDIFDDDLRSEMFKAAVNCGVSRASKWFQSGINLLQDVGGRFLFVDGLIGPMTLEFYHHLKEKDHKFLRFIFKAYLSYHYIHLAEKNETQKRFLRGWINRMN